MDALHDMADNFEVARHLAVHGLPESHDALALAQRMLDAAGFEPGPADGLVGPRTRGAYARMRAAYTHDDGDLSVIRYDEDGGLDLRSVGHYRPHRRSAVQCIVLHWPAGSTTTTHGLHQIFSAPRRQVSSHFGIDASPHVYEFLPHEAAAWHATWINNVAIGGDINQPCEPQYIERARLAGYDVEVVDNPTERGMRKCLSLDRRVAARALAYVQRLCDLHDIPLEAPRGMDGRVRHDVVFESLADLGDWRGVVGHHHIDKRKQDIAPWWGSIFDGTTAGD